MEEKEPNRKTKIYNKIKLYLLLHVSILWRRFRGRGDDERVIRLSQCDSRSVAQTIFQLALDRLLLLLFLIQ